MNFWIYTAAALQLNLILRAVVSEPSPHGKRTAHTLLGLLWNQLWDGKEIMDTRVLGVCILLSKCNYCFAFRAVARNITGTFIRLSNSFWQAKVVKGMKCASFCWSLLTLLVTSQPVTIWATDTWCEMRIWSIIKLVNYVEIHTLA